MGKCCLSGMTAHPPSGRIFNIADSTRDKVYVQMLCRLPGCLATIDADIVSGNQRIITHNIRYAFLKHANHSQDFCIRGVKDALYMTMGHNFTMSGRYGYVIQPGKAKLIFIKYSTAHARLITQPTLRHKKTPFNGILV
jgi:hypothetical protein